MNHATIKTLNAILLNIPSTEWENIPHTTFRTDILVEERGLPHDYDRIIADFLVKGQFVSVIDDHDFFARNFESRTFELTEKGMALKEAGSYQEYIGLFRTILLKLLQWDQYDWWLSISKGKKDFIVAVILAVATALLYEFFKHVVVGH